MSFSGFRTPSRQGQGQGQSQEQVLAPALGPDPDPGGFDSSGRIVGKHLDLGDSPGNIVDWGGM